MAISNIALGIIAISNIAIGNIPLGITAISNIAIGNIPLGIIALGITAAMHMEITHKNKLE